MLALWIILGIIVLLVLWFIGVYNSLVQLRNKVRNQFSQIDVQLKRRFDLIPNLVETVKGYAKHESETFEKVIAARSSYASATTDSEKIDAANQMTQAVRGLLAIAEAYPELKANTNFMSLQNDLKETEEKISYARQFYNDSVMVYNNKIQVIPSNIVAGIAGFKAEKLFEAGEQERENVKVEF